MKEKIVKYGSKAVIQSQERINHRLGDRLLIEPNLSLLLDILAHSEKIIDQMSSQELENHKNKVETIKDICDYYGDPDFSLLNRNALSLITNKYLSFPDIQVKALTNALLWNLIHLILRTNRENNNYFITQFLFIIRNKRILKMLERENICEKIKEELENDSYDIDKLKQILKPFIDNVELPSLTNQLLEINHDKDKEKLEKLYDEVVQKWIDKNPIPNDRKDSYTDNFWAEDDEFYNSKKTLINTFIKKI